MLFYRLRPQLYLLGFVLFSPCACFSTITAPQFDESEAINTDSTMTESQIDESESTDTESQVDESESTNTDPTMTGSQIDESESVNTDGSQSAEDSTGQTSQTTLLAISESVTVIEDISTAIYLKAEVSDNSIINTFCSLRSYPQSGSLRISESGPIENRIPLDIRNDPPTIFFQTHPNSVEEQTFTFVVKQNKRAGPPSALKLDDSELGTITILVTPVNDAPNAVDQTVEVNKGESVEITLTGDDGDEDEEQTLIYILKSLPSLGTLTQDGEQSPILNQQLPLVLNSVNLNYSAETSHAGPINFFYVVEDTGGVENGGQNTSAPGEIIINVNPVNAAPMAEAQNVDVDEDKEVEIILSASYADSEANELLHYFVTALPAHGVLSKTSGGTAIKDSDLPIQLDADRLNYLPNPDYFGNDNFTFKATNNGSTDQGDIDESSAAQITINVSPINDLPRFTIEKPEDLMEDFGTITISIIPDAVPTNEQEQTVTYSVEPSSSALIEYSLDTTPPKLNLHSIEAKSGTVTLNIVADDGLGKFTVENFTITVSAPNDEPIAKSQSLETHENTPLAITLVTHDGDEDIQALSYYLSSLPNQGTLSETADGDAITFDVLPFPLNSSSLYYHPNSHTHGNDGFEFYVTDDGDTEENGVIQSSVAQITITVVSIDAPL